MRFIVVGIVIGSVIGVMVGTNIIAPRLVDVRSQNPEPVTQKATLPPATKAVAQRPSSPLQRPNIHWRMASAYSGNLPQLGSLAKRVGRNIWEVSEGGIEIKLFEPGTLVPSGKMFDAVSSGTIDAAFSSPGSWSQKEPSLQLFSAVPFGPPPAEYLAWMYFGGGQELLNEIYHPYGIHSVICGMIAPQASGWFRRSFTLPEDLKGLRMRASGLGAIVLQKLGVKTRSLEVADIFQAFENGEIDAAQFSMPAIDLKLGFYQLASHYYFPGWHQLSSFFDLMINKDKWDALAKAQQSQIQAVCGDNVRYGLAEGESLQYDALKELTAKNVKILRWPSPILNALRDAWKEVAQEQAAADDKFKAVWGSLSNFRKDYAIWNELARP